MAKRFGLGGCLLAAPAFAYNTDGAFKRMLPGGALLPVREGEAKMRDLHVSEADLAVLAEREPPQDLADHLFSCVQCWRQACAVLARIDRASPAMRAALVKGEPVRWALLERFRLEQARLEEGLAVAALISSIREMDQKQRKDAVSREAGFHTRIAVRSLLDEARGASSPDEGQEWASLAIIAAHLIPGPPSDPARSDLLAEIYAELAAARRRSARWASAKEAVRQGHQHREKGAGSKVALGHLLMVEGCIEGDLGNFEHAQSLLEAAADSFKAATANGLAAKATIQIAYVWLDVAPGKTLTFLLAADHLIPPSNYRLKMFSESIRVDALITLGLAQEAMRRFEALTDIYEQFGDPFVQLRRRFTMGRLLEAVGRYDEADQLFSDVITADLEQRSNKSYFLDLIYLLDSKARRNDLRGALAVCDMALAAIGTLGLDTRSEEQITAIWERLRRSIVAGALESQIVLKARTFIKTQWAIVGGDALLVKESALSN
jgi:tetratricopeptide (TPR) repeat protein